MILDPTLAPEVAERVADSFSRQGLMAHLGATIKEIGVGRVLIELQHSRGVTQQHGYFHAGATSAIADTAGGYAGLTQFGLDDSVLTVDFSINLLAPALGTTLEAEGSVVRAGRTITVCELDVYCLGSHGTKHVATGRQTLIRLADTADR